MTTDSSPSRDEAGGISPGTATESTRAITPPTARRRSHTSRSCGAKAPRTWCCRGRASGGWSTTRRSERTSTPLTGRSEATSTRSSTSSRARRRSAPRRARGRATRRCRGGRIRPGSPSCKPTALPAASQYRNGDEARRALVLGIYLAGQAEHRRARRQHASQTAATSRSSSAGSRSAASPLTEISAR